MRVSWAEPVYEAAKLFQERCLLDEGSFLWPAKRVWTSRNVDGLWQAFVGNPDEGNRPFLQKWHDQLANEPEDVHRVAVDLLAFYYVFPSNIGQPRKFEVIEEVVSWKLSESPPDFDLLERTFRSQVGSGGMQYTRSMPWQLMLYLEFAQKVRSEGIAPTDREAYQATADELREKIGGRSNAARNILLHLFFPEWYERVATEEQRQAIIAAFPDRAADGEEVDEKLLNIRRSLEEEYGRDDLDFYDANDDLDFYDANIEPLWNRELQEEPEEQEETAVAEPRYWVEKTLVTNRPDREAGDYALGKALWSPRASDNGADIYRFMREAGPGDVVLHLTDDHAFTGVSRVASAYEEFGGVPGTEWGEQPSYLVRLEDFTPLNPPLSRNTFFSPPYGERLARLREAGITHLFYNKKLKLNQGKYFTPAPSELVQMLNDAYVGLAGIPMIDVDTDGGGQSGDRSRERRSGVHPLNLVLYGPPGTGKTYSVQRRVLDILEGDATGLSEGEVGERYRRYASEGRVEFVTFHPSYSYEEFVEGFRYDEDSKIPTLHKGVFRRLVEQALSPPRSANADGARIWKVSLWGPGPDVYDRCINRGEIAIGWLEDKDLAGMGREEIADLYAEDYGTRRHTNNVNSINSLVNEIRDGDYVAVLKNQREIHAIGVVKGAYRYGGEEYGRYFPHTRPVDWLDTNTHDVYKMNGGTNLTLKTIYALDRIPLQEFVGLLPEQQQEAEPHVLVIDEINRGNVSRIFGELVTLLEEDKRLDAPNELSVRLPYSGKPFVVPPNLHVIGTMNTADRSIALIDSALRRRFQFEEVMPDVRVVREILSEKMGQPEAGTSAHVDLVCGVFQALNRRVAVLLDRDHQVGHSYFLDATDIGKLQRALYRNVFPLLQEYFYNDAERLRRLLGEYDAGAHSGFLRQQESYRDAFGEEEVLDEELPWEIHVYPTEELGTVLRNTFLTQP